MIYRALGQTDIEVSSVCMGCWAIVGDMTWGPQDESDAIAAIRASLDVGVNFFDTAEAYGDGDSEELLAKALDGCRGEAVIATKVSAAHLAAADLRQHCEDSLRRLRTDYIDLYQIHWPSREVPISDSLETLVTLRREGRVRAIGVSNFAREDLTELFQHGRAESDQLPYSLLWRAIEFEVQPLCVAHETSILCYSPLCQGLLTGKFATADDVPPGRARTRLFSCDRPQARHEEPGYEAETFAAIDRVHSIANTLGIPMGRAALAWLLAQPAVTSVIAGARNAEQARENAMAAAVELDAATIAQLSAATADIKQHFGLNADMWQSESRMR